jgi:hypothetical protein
MVCEVSSGVHSCRVHVAVSNLTFGAIEQSQRRKQGPWPCAFVVCSQGDSSMTPSSMRRTTDPRRGLARCLGLAAATMVLLAAAPSPRAEAKSLASSPVVSSLASTAKAAAGGFVTEVRSGGGGHGGAGGSHMGGGMHSGGGMHVGGYHGGGWHGGSMHHGGGFHHGGFRFAHHHRHFFGGSYYPDYFPDYYYYPRCRTVWTSYGPHRVCYHRHWHRWHRRHHWHHRHY